MARVLLVAAALTEVLGQVVINEVSDKGVPNFCSGDDWVEVANTGGNGQTYNLTGWMLCDSDGCSDDDAYTFGEVILAPSEYAAVCHLAPKNRTHRRWISSNDTITLYDALGAAVVAGSEEQVAPALLRGVAKVVRAHEGEQATLQLRVGVNVCAGAMRYQHKVGAVKRVHAVRGSHERALQRAKAPRRPPAE